MLNSQFRPSFTTVAGQVGASQPTPCFNETMFLSESLRVMPFKGVYGRKGVKPVLLIHPVQTRWDTWIDTAIYQSTYLLTFYDFFQCEVVESTLASVEKLRELMNNRLYRLLAEASFF